MLPPALSKADIHLLYVFATVAEARGFSAAQIELNVSASTISRQITDLEHRLGMVLCQRGRAGFRLTEEGERVYQAAQGLFASIRDFSESVDRSRGRLGGTLSLAVIDNWVFTAASPFARALERFAQAAPDVVIELFSLAPDDVELAVQDGRAALGFGVFHRQQPGLDYSPIATEVIGLYCGAGHPLFGERDADAVHRGLGIARYARRAYLKEAEVAPVSRQLKTSAHVHQIEGTAHLILTGSFIGYLPQPYAEIWTRTGRMGPVGDGRYDQLSELMQTRRRGVDLSPAARLFEELVANAAAEGA